MAAGLAPQQKLLLFLAGGACGFAPCQLLSWWAESRDVSLLMLKPTGPFSFGRVLNPGFLGGFFPRLVHSGQGATWLIMAVASLLAGWYLWKRASVPKDFLLLGLLIGAGASTLVDRMRLGGVVDYFLVHASATLPATAFNLPDVVIPVAAVLIALRLLLDRAQEEPRQE